MFNTLINIKFSAVLNRLIKGVLIIIAAAQVSIHQSYGQQPSLKFDWLTSENTMTVKGLSQNSVFCLIQDSKGFIWIGTWDGLNKYDGYEYIIYNTSNGLSSPTVNALLEDDESNIWIGTDNGLNLLDRESGKLSHFHHQAENRNSISHNVVNHIFQDRKGYLWISTAYGLSRYDYHQNSFTSYNFFEKDADSATTNFITRVREDIKGNLWISTHFGIHYYNTEKQSFEFYQLEKDQEISEFRRRNYVQDIAFDGSGMLYAGTLGGVFVLKPGKGVIRHISSDRKKELYLTVNQVNAILVDEKGLVWLGTSRGLDVYDPVTNVISRYKAGLSLNNLSNEDVRSFFQDQAGTIWIGTYKGLNKVDRSPSKFLHYQNLPESPNSLSNNIVYDIQDCREGHLWIGTFDGLNRFDRVNEQFTVIRHIENDPASISSNKIRTIVMDSAGYLWVGTENRGMNRINTRTGQIRHYVHNDADSNSILEDNILSSYVDSQGRIWIGTVSRGVSILDPESGKAFHLSDSPDSRVRLSDNKIWTIYEDRIGNFWLGTNQGLNKISPGFKMLNVYRHDPLNESSISTDRIFSVYQDEDGIYWIGTMGGGLNRFDPMTAKFVTYDEHDGLSNNVVYATLDDGEGNLWLCTNWGISKFNKTSETFVNYDTKDGVQGNEFNIGAAYRNKKGEMFFGGMNGFNVFYPSEITMNKVPPRIVFTGLRVMNDLLFTDLEDGQVIRLNYNESIFSVEFSGLDYTNPQKNQYRYKLENYDEDWIMANAYQRRAEYRKVGPGYYRFIVTGSNNDGVWNEKGISLTLIVRPPWWKNWIFRTIFLLVSVLLLWSIIVIRVKSIKRKHEVEKKMLTIEKQVFELEQKALRLQMNPHFMFNSLNAIQNFVLANDTDKAVNYLAKFSHLMRMILANSTAALITLKDELKSLTYYIDLEKLRFDDKFDYVINRDPSIDEEFIEIPPMLFQPYVENAIIHGLVNSNKRGFLEISIKQMKQGVLLCSVRDNGIGREKAIEIKNASGIKRQPKGMMITQERIEVFNQQNGRNFSVRITDLKDELGNPSGTLVEFTIRYKTS